MIIFNDLSLFPISFRDSIPDMDDHFKNIFVPKTYSNVMEVEVAINQSIDKIMGEVFQKYPRKKLRKEKPGEVLVGNVSVGTEIGTYIRSLC